MIEALRPISQRDLLAPYEVDAGLTIPDKGGAAWHATVATGAIITPMPQQEN